MAVSGDAEQRSERRLYLACQLVRSSAWGADLIDHRRPYEPSRLVADARRAVRGLDAADARTVADRLAETSRLLLQLVEEVRYPLWTQGHEPVDYYRDEAEELVSLLNDEDVLALAPRTLYRRIRRNVDALAEPVAAFEADFDVVARNGYRRTVNYAKLEAVTDPAGDTGLLCALLAVELDATVVDRLGSR
jgi:hypothetical protein